MAWVCPYCKRQHNKIASSYTLNGVEVKGFCSDSCLSAYRAEHPNANVSAVDAEVAAKSKGKGLVGKLAAKAGGEVKKAALRDLNTLKGNLLKGL
jgi:hypothetical protein